MIIIVGVGNADFTDMIVLDADEHPIHDQSGRRVSRHCAICEGTHSL